MTHDANEREPENARPDRGKDTPDERNTDAWGQRGTPGMVGSGGSVANLDFGQPGAAPVGMPETPGTVASPGTGVNFGDMDVSSTGRTSRILGTLGNVGPAEQGNLEPGTTDVPGTPTPTPVPGQTAGVAGPDPDSPTPLGADAPSMGSAPPSGGDLNAGSSYGRSGTPGLGGARPSGDTPAEGDDDANTHPTLDAEGHQVRGGDNYGARSEDGPNQSGGSGIPGLGGSQGGTPNYGGMGVPGGARTLGEGSAPDARRQSSAPGVPATGGLSAPPNAERGHGSVIGSTVLPGGATRPNSPPPQEQDEIRMKNGDEYQTRTSDQGEPRYPQPDPIHGTGAGAAANDVSQGGAEAATDERIGQRPAIAGSPAPMTAPPAPTTDNPFGGTQSESAANPLQESPIPQEPTPGVTREPGPEARH